MVGYGFTVLPEWRLRVSQKGSLFHSRCSPFPVLLKSSNLTDISLYSSFFFFFVPQPPRTPFAMFIVYNRIAFFCVSSDFFPRYKYIYMYMYSSFCLFRLTVCLAYFSLSKNEEHGACFFFF